MYTTVKLRKETKALLEQLLREYSKERKVDYDTLIRELVLEKMKEKTKKLEEFKRMKVDIDLQAILKEGRREDDRF